MDEQGQKYIPALGFKVFTRFYDPIVNWTTRENAFKDALVAQSDLQNNQKILDLGCGTATLCLKIKKIVPNAQLFGIDVDEKMLRMARHKALKAGVKINFGQGFSDALPYAESVFDRVLSTLFFHHLNNIQKKATLAEVFRALKPNGELRIADFGAPQNALQHFFSHYLQLIDSVETTKDNLQGQLPFLISEAGFIKIERTDFYNTIVGTIRLFKAIKP